MLAENLKASFVHECRQSGKKFLLPVFAYMLAMGEMCIGGCIWLVEGNADQSFVVYKDQTYRNSFCVANQDS